MVVMVEHFPAELYKVTDPQWYAQWQTLRRQLVQEAIKLPQPHIIEGTYVLAAPELTTGHRRILIDTPLHQIIRQHLARDRASTPRTRYGTLRGMPACWALLRPGGALYGHGRSTKGCNRRFRPSGSSLG